MRDDYTGNADFQAPEDYEAERPAEVEEKKRTLLFHFNVSLPADSTATIEDVAAEFGGALAVGIDPGHTTVLAAEGVEIDLVLAQEV